MTVGGQRPRWSASRRWLDGADHLNASRASGLGVCRQVWRPTASKCGDLRKVKVR